MGEAYTISGKKKLQINNQKIFTEILNFKLRNFTLKAGLRSRSSSSGFYLHVMIQYRTKYLEIACNVICILKHSLAARSVIVAT